jgi:hypothetical protein
VFSALEYSARLLSSLCKSLSGRPLVLLRYQFAKMCSSPTLFEGIVSFWDCTPQASLPKMFRSMLQCILNAASHVIAVCYLSLSFESVHIGPLNPRAWNWVSGFITPTSDWSFVLEDLIYWLIPSGSCPTTAALLSINSSRSPIMILSPSF